MPVTVAEQASAGAPIPVVQLAAAALAVTGEVDRPVMGLVAAGMGLAQPGTSFTGCHAVAQPGGLLQSSAKQVTTRKAVP